MNRVASSEVLSELGNLVDQATPVIERALGDHDARFGKLSPELRLRQPVCGIVSETHRTYLAELGYAAETRRRRWRWEDRPMEHVLLVIPTDDPIILDSTYGQFFEPFGMAPDYATHFDRLGIFPDEKYLLFADSNRATVIDWLTEVTLQFDRTERGRPEFSEHTTWGYRFDGPLDRLQIRRYFSEIFQLAEYQPWDPAPNPAKYGRQFADRLHREISLS